MVKDESFGASNTLFVFGVPGIRLRARNALASVVFEGLSLTVTGLSSRVPSEVSFTGFAGQFGKIPLSIASLAFVVRINVRLIRWAAALG